MKRCIGFFLLAAFLLGLTGCGRWFQEDYQSVTPHVEQPIPTSQAPEEEQPPVVTNRNELRGAVLSFIRNWTESGTLLVEGYDGDISADLTETLEYATKEDPIGAYAVDFADAELEGTAQKGSIALSLVFRRSAAEIDSIVTVSGNNSAYMKIHSTLAAYGTALTLRIKNYRETDFAADIRSYCLENPDQVVCVPEISAAVYPSEGETRILELHFTYPGTRDEMRQLQDSLNTILSSAASYIRSGANEEEKAALLYRFLCTRFDYTLSDTEPTMPAYQLLCQGEANSLSFASVFYSECTTAGLTCLLVSGTMDAAPYYWNMLRVGDRYYFVDLMRSLTLEESELQLLTTDTLLEEGYSWVSEDYPAAVFSLPDPAETVQPSSEYAPELPSEDPTQSSSAP